MLERNKIIVNRYRKCRELREKGINPFPYRYNATHKSSEILNKVEELINSKEQVKVAGRMLTIRSFGKTAFFHLQDSQGKIQIYIKEDIVGAEQFDFFTQYLDTGDIIGVEGEVFRTKTGEVTVAAKGLLLLAKAMRPLPEKWHGLKDVELRYRQRYLDLIVNQEVKENFLLRTKIIKMMRQYLDEQGYVEVETPMMQPVYGGARARPFTTYHNVLGLNLYLRIAPELYLKRLVVGGLEKVYEINRSFRNEGISTQHNPEFTMLELYTAYWNYQDMMNFLEELIKEVCRQVSSRLNINYQGNQIDLSGEWPRMTVLKAIEEETGLKLDWRDSKDKLFQELAGVVEINQEIEQLSATELILHVFDSRVEDKLIKPIFITEFPKALSPLAKAKDGNPTVAERFELFIGGLEVANAYSELNDPEEQYEAFKEQMERRQKGDLEAFMMDEDYIRALEYGMPPTSGLGVGIDRLVMLLTDSPSIREVILFPQLRPESGEPATIEESQETKEL